MSTKPARRNARTLDDEALHAWPLPMPSSDGDKEQRGHVLVVAGSREMPGAAVLAATAALRAGAGKVAIASGAAAAQNHSSGGPGSARRCSAGNCRRRYSPGCRCSTGAAQRPFDAMLFGPGMQDEDSRPASWSCGRCPHCARRASSWMRSRWARSTRVTGLSLPLLLTPHAGEMAHLLDIAKEAVQS